MLGATAEATPHPQTMVLRVPKATIGGGLSENVKKAIAEGHGVVLHEAAKWFDGWNLAV